MPLSDALEMGLGEAAWWLDAWADMNRPPEGARQATQEDVDAFF